MRYQMSKTKDYCEIYVATTWQSRLSSSNSLNKQILRVKSAPTSRLLRKHTSF